MKKEPSPHLWMSPEVLFAGGRVKEKGGEREGQTVEIGNYRIKNIRQHTITIDHPSIIYALGATISFLEIQGQERRKGKKGRGKGKEGVRPCLHAHYFVNLLHAREAVCRLALPYKHRTVVTRKRKGEAREITKKRKGGLYETRQQSYQRDLGPIQNAPGT